jgi:hypothetical protein
MAEKPRCLDLFCGRGGWTRGFLDAGYEVTGIDILPRHKTYPEEATYIQTDLMGYDAGTGWDVIVASPPCTGFSLANTRGGAEAREGRCRAGMLLVNVAYRIIRQSAPQYWAIENVRGAKKWFRPLLGEPAYTDGTWFIWGDFPAWLASRANRHYKGMGGKNKSGMHTFIVRTGPEAGKVKHNYRTTWGRPGEIAIVPYDIARGLAEACKP